MTAPSITYHPSPLPATRIAEIREDYRRGKYSPGEMIAAQNAEVQPCVQHLDRPCCTLIDGEPRCLECFERLRGAGRA